MRDLEPVPVHRQQPTADEGLDDPRRAAASALEVQFGKRQRPADQRATVVGVSEPDERPAGESWPASSSARTRLPPTGSARRPHPGLQVAGQRQEVAATALPGAHEGGRQERQRAGLPKDVGDHGVDQFGIDRRPTGRAGSRTISRSSGR